MTTTHHCNGTPENGQVCSHLVTEALLTGWSFPVRKVEKVVGTPVVVRDGDEFSDALYKAWLAGNTRLCTRTARVTV